MSDIQWGITTIVAILGVLGGRFWKQQEYKVSKDLKTMSRFNEILPFSLMNEIHEHDFGSSFNNDIFTKLLKVFNEYKKPDFMFLNKSIEKVNKELIDKLIEFSSFLGLNSGPIQNVNFSRIPLEYDIPTEEEKEVIRKVEQLADEVFDLYSKIKTMAHSKL